MAKFTQVLKMLRPHLSRAFFISLLGPILGNPMVLEVIVMVTPVRSQDLQEEEACEQPPLLNPGSGST